MGGGPARIYPKANATAQWWETHFSDGTAVSRGTFSGIEKILLHTTETTGWPGYSGGRSAPTLTYHPRLRLWRQHNYIDRSARALMDPSGTVVRENRDNIVQVEIIAYSDERIAATVGGLKVSDLTDDHYRDLAAFVAWVRSEWGGPPLVAPKFLAYPGSYGASSVRMTGPEYDAFRGILGHQHASGNDHGDPSNIDAPKLLRFVSEIEGATTSPEEDDMPTADEIAKAVHDRNVQVGDEREPLGLAVGRARAMGRRTDAKVDALTSGLAQVLTEVLELPAETGAVLEQKLKDAVVSVEVNFPVSEPTP